MYKSFYNYFLKIVLISVVLSIFIVGGFWFRQIYIVYTNDIASIEQQHIEQKKILLQSLVNSVIKVGLHLGKQNANDTISLRQSTINALSNVASVSSVENGQINIYTLEGICIATSGDCGNLGKQLLNTESKDKKKYIAQGFQKAKNGGGFIEYKLLIDGIVHSKMGYFKALEEFDLIISSCQSYNEIDSALLKQKDVLKTNLIHSLLSLFFISTVLSALIFYIFKILFQKMQKEYLYINQHLVEAQSKDVHINNSNLQFEEFYKMAELINQLVASRSTYEHNLLQEKQKLAIANNAKSQFIAQMSHEIRTPMNSILGFSELLKHTPLDEKQVKYLDSISVSASILLKTLSDILDAGKLEANKMQVHTECICLEDFILEIETLFQARAKNKGLNFTIASSVSMPFAFICDRAKLMQIISNLLDNAIKFTDAGHIYFKIYEHDTCIIFEVSDSGIGIDAKNFEQIFEPFEQEKDIMYTYGGSGLGLYIVKNLVQLLDGTFSFDSQKNKGSTFRISLHLTLCEPKHQGIHLNTTKISQKQPLVLIVDDQDRNRELLKEMLEKFSIVTIEATDGKKALTLLQTHTPHLILTDIIMPVMDGIKLATHLKRDNFQAPIIAISADISSLGAHYHKLFDDILLKPINLNQIQNICEKYLHVDLEYSYALSDEEKKALPNLICELEHLLETRMQILDMIVDFDECHNFLDTLKAINEKYKNPYLEQYVAYCTKEMQMFDIAKMQDRIQNFRHIINKLKKEITT